MTIKKWYEITCDSCGVAINHTPFYPTKEQYDMLEFIGYKRKHFCDEDCKEKFINSIKQEQKK